MSVDYSDSHIRKRAKEFYLEVSKAGNKWVFTEACYNLWGTSVVRYGNCEAIQTINEYGMWLRDIAIELAEIKIKMVSFPLQITQGWKAPMAFTFRCFSFLLQKISGNISICVLWSPRILILLDIQLGGVLELVITSDSF